MNQDCDPDFNWPAFPPRLDYFIVHGVVVHSYNVDKTLFRVSFARPSVATHSVRDLVILILLCVLFVTFALCWRWGVRF
jgi:hypothetical protein